MKSGVVAAVVGRTAEVAGVGTMTTTTKMVETIRSSRSEGVAGALAEEVVAVVDEVALTAEVREIRTGIDGRVCFRLNVALIYIIVVTQNFFLHFHFLGRSK